ncbi:hypothetical protein EJ07DRAFT_182922 [Lizonia empirigonia]|nr:hypothetical protein EJ07DRAFT_182922 [Lizonia empirigonia]
MTVIWGLDLKAMQWGSSYMFGNKDHHSAAQNSASTKAPDPHRIRVPGHRRLRGPTVLRRHPLPQRNSHNNTFIGIASYNISVGIYVATTSAPPSSSTSPGPRAVQTA